MPVVTADRLAAGVVMAGVTIYQQHTGWVAAHGDYYERDASGSIVIDPVLGYQVDQTKWDQYRKDFNIRAVLADFCMAFARQAVTATIYGGRLGTLPLLSNLTSGAAWGQFLGREGLFALYSSVVGAIRSVFWCSNPIDTALASWQGGAAAGVTNNVLHALLMTSSGRKLFPGGFADPLFAGFVRSASGAVNQVISRVMWEVAPSPAGCSEGIDRIKPWQTAGSF